MHATDQEDASPGGRRQLVRALTLIPATSVILANVIGTGVFVKARVMTCNVGTPGMVLSSVDMVNRNDTLDEKTVRRELEGNICRCTGYHNIVKAILAAAPVMKG